MLNITQLLGELPLDDFLSDTLGRAFRVLRAEPDSVAGLCPAEHVEQLLNHPRLLPERVIISTYRGEMGVADRVPQEDYTSARHQSRRCSGC